MDRAFKLTRIILCMFSIIIANVLSKWQGMSFRIFLSIAMPLITFLLCFITAPISKLIIKTGKRIHNIFLRIVYYVCIIPIVFFFIALIWNLTDFLGEITPHADGFASTLRVGIIYLFLGGFLVICAAVPYAQALIVLLINQIQNLRTSDE